MKVLDPVEKEAIPPARVRPSVHRALYDQVLALNGLALPVEFENCKKARNFRALLDHPRSLGRRLGLGAIMRDKTVFLYRKDA